MKNTKKKSATTAQAQQRFATALQHHVAGRIAEAIAEYQRVLQIDPAHFDALNNLAAALGALQRHDEALPFYRRAIAIKPDFAAAHLNLGNSLLALGQQDAALAALESALASDPHSINAHFNLGNLHKTMRHWDDAVRCYQAALQLQATHMPSLINLGVTWLALKQAARAESCFSQALACEPHSTAALTNRGAALLALDRYAEAAQTLQAALALDNRLVDAHANLGNAYQSLGQLDEAIACYRTALSLQPDYPDAHNNLGLVMRTLQQPAEAIACFQRAIACKPDYAEAYSNLGNCLRDAGQPEQAIACFQRALALRPDYADALSNLASAQRDAGWLDAAVESLSAALALNPQLFAAHSNLLFILASQLSECQGPAFDAYRGHLAHFNQAVQNAVAGRAYRQWRCDPNPQRLRVGFVSGDFRLHPVGYFFSGILPHLAALDVDVLLYPTTRQEDALTRHFQAHCQAWRPIHALSNADAATLIHGDGVHLLIDLSGHTDKNRLPVFGWRPAPVQVSWLGYFASTGLAQMDAILLDPVGVPQHASGDHVAQFSEQIWLLPETRLSFTPPPDAPPVTSLPALHTGHFTFGCVQSLAKVSDTMIVLWGRILAGLPQARLVWQSKQFKDAAVVAATLQRLAQLGLPTQQVCLQGPMARTEYLQALGQIDMLLDTFPYPGGTTTCEALWMGVPTLTLAGETVLARQGASLLSAAGLADWITHSADDYVAQAIHRATQPEVLARLRPKLRGQLISSAVFDNRRFALLLREAFAALWQHFTAAR